jgi:uncharacterized protein (DUF736 family)
MAEGKEPDFRVTAYDMGSKAKGGTCGAAWINEVNGQQVITIKFNHAPSIRYSLWKNDGRGSSKRTGPYGVSSNDVPF